MADSGLEAESRPEARTYGSCNEPPSEAQGWLSKCSTRDPESADPGVDQTVPERPTAGHHQ